jgi:hypothetical protein
VQSVFDAHVVRQAVGPQMYCMHEAVLGPTQVPAPSQVLGGVYVATEHDSGAQVVPRIHRRQPPAPSQVPSRPQLEAGSAGHSLSGSVPAVIGRQRPSAAPVREAEQAAQEPAQADSQQTPSTQKPLVHSADPPQAAPFAFTDTHWPAMQKLPVVQSAFEAHVVLQAVAPQT